MFYGTYCPFCFARKEKGFGIVSCVSSYALKGPWDQIAMDIHNGFKEGDYVSHKSLFCMWTQGKKVTWSYPPLAAFRIPFGAF